MSIRHFLKNNFVGIILCVVSFFVFAQGLSIHGLEYRDDEIFYVKSTQEMLGQNNYLSPTYFEENRFQKPILFYWLILLFYKMFGVGWFAARLVSVLFASLTIYFTWALAKDMLNKNVALLSSVILISVPLFFRHAKNAVPDMALNFFIVLAMYSLYKFSTTQRQKYSIWFFVSCGLGFMIKGFAALIFPLGALCVYAFLIKKPSLIFTINLLRGLFILLLIILPWFLYMIKIHGSSYWEYMVVSETRNRLLTGGGNVYLDMVKNFFRHSLFYLEVLATYFAPWSLFLIGAVPLAFLKGKKTEEEHRSCLLLLFWFFFVFCFFSLMHFRISHYVLVLSTPFVILIGHFLCKPFNENTLTNRFICFVRKYTFVLLTILGIFLVSILFVLLVGLNKWWLIAFAMLGIILVSIVHRAEDPLRITLPYTIFIILIFAQTPVLAKAGVSLHSTLQKFAKTINEEKESTSIISVGSNDIHEKEFQIYFDQRVKKSASDVDSDTQRRLRILFDTRYQVYCLMTEKDFDNLLKNTDVGPLSVIQEEYMFRKRMFLDKNFLIGLLKFDYNVVNYYLKEKVVLVRKDANVGPET